MSDLKPLEWKNDRLILLDQTLLPAREKYLNLSDYQDVVLSINRMAVRGAPAIGIAAAYGVALGALTARATTLKAFNSELRTILKRLGATRPTARNLFWALDRMQRIIEEGVSIPAIRQSLIQEAQKIHAEQDVSDRFISQLGASLFDEKVALLTHCNAGALATAGYGTALGIIKQSYNEGKISHVFATETRPLLQGARLTAFELKKAGIPFTLITDSMAGAFMRQGKFQAVVVGADRIARNGDTANKIGTYSLAMLAKEHGLPFYVAAPTSTVDLSIASGKEIIIEERSPSEVTSFQGCRTAPRGIQAANPAFDMTPHEYITAIVTEKGIFRGEYSKKFALAHQLH
jgi:methylthioribose-1-phosphate isomerase